jgi:hypothetical protein
VTSIALYLVLTIENRRRAALHLDESQRDKVAFSDLTDKENPFFRYVL